MAADIDDAMLKKAQEKLAKAESGTEQEEDNEPADRDEDSEVALNDSGGEASPQTAEIQSDAQENTAVAESLGSLDKTPVYTPYVAGYKRELTPEGIKEADTATLKRYYSSIDAEIYFGNEYVEDVCDINYSIQQQNMPIYGFNSYTFDDIAIGARIIQGQFAIRFTSPNYLFKLLAEAKKNTALHMSSYVVPTHDRVLGEVEGQIDTNLKGEVSGTNEKELWPNYFDIDIIFGHPTRGNREVHVVLEDVRIISCQNGASVNSPTPVTEIYSFVAKDIKTLD